MEQFGCLIFTIRRGAPSALAQAVTSLIASMISRFIVDSFVLDSTNRGGLAFFSEKNQRPTASPISRLVGAGRGTSQGERRTRWCRIFSQIIGLRLSKQKSRELNFPAKFGRGVQRREVIGG